MSGKMIGPFRVISQIDNLGVGEVYLAEDTRGGRQVAIKMVAAGLKSNPAAVKSFERQAQNAMALSHPGLATVYETGVFEGRPFVAMEYVTGRSLAQKLAASGPLSHREVSRVAQVAAEALSYAHGLGLLHGDLKSSSIMITPEEDVKVLDLGLSKRESGRKVTVDGTTVEAAFYLSPEVVAGQPATVQSDLWSLGVVLYECLTGRVPFAGETMEFVTGRILNYTPPKPSALRTGIPANLNQAILRCLEKKPELRFPQMSDFLEALTGQPPVVAPVPPPVAAAPAPPPLAVAPPVAAAPAPVVEPPPPAEPAVVPRVPAAPAPALAPAPTPAAAPASSRGLIIAVVVLAVAVVVLLVVLLSGRR